MADDPRETVLTFLSALWRSDRAAVVAMLAPSATVRIARSLADRPGAVPAAQALGWMIDRLFTRFRPDPGIVATIHRVLTDGPVVMVEYGATGVLIDGAAYANDYVMSITVENGRVAEIRPYTDTKYIHEILILGAAA